MVIVHAAGDDFPVRVFPPHQLHGGIQIHHKLELQAVIQGQKLELPVPRFIVNDFHIDLAPLFPGVHPVNPAPEPHFFLVA